MNFRFSLTFLFKIKNTDGVTIDNDFTLSNSATVLPSKGYTGRIFAKVGGRKRTVTKIDSPDEIYNLLDSTWHAAGFDEIVYFDDGVDRIQVWSGTGKINTGVTCELITGQPKLVYWGYVVVNEKAVYNPSSSRNFDLHESERADLVAKILKLAGISMEDQELYQAGAAEEALNTQQENK